VTDCVCKQQECVCDQKVHAGYNLLCNNYIPQTFKRAVFF